MVTAHDILAAKHASPGSPPQVVDCTPVDTVYDAVARMAEHSVGALLVMIDDAVVGIISERDYARKVILKDRASRTTRVSEIMTGTVHTVPPETTLADCLAVLARHHIRHLPVVAEGTVLGMLSTRDLLRALVAEQARLLASQPPA